MVSIAMVFKRLSKINIKVITPINHNRHKNSMIRQSEFLEITCNWLKAREKKLRVQGAIAFGVASHQLKKLTRYFFSQSLSEELQSRYYFRQSFESCFNKLTSGIAR